MGAIAPVIFAVAIVGGLLFAARALLSKPKGAPDGLGEDTPPLISTRGSWVPVYYGTNITKRVLVGWAGNRKVKKESVGGGGGKGGGGSGGVKQSVYFEEVWHILGVGPASTLHEIRFNGKIVWQGPITCDSTPSGTEIDVGKEGVFRIYWGEKEQPVNDWLGDESRIGISSRWPRICYVVWIKMRYGTSPAQPQVEYVLSWDCQGANLQNSAYNLDDGTSTGINPAHILHILLNGKQFVGAGIKQEEIDNDSLESLGELMESEHLPVNLDFIDGPTVQSGVEAILQDMGIMMPQVDTRLAFIPQRYVDMADLPVLTDDEIAPPDNERTVDLSPPNVTRPVFTFRSEDGFNFRDQDIPLDDDGDADQAGLSTATRVPISTVTNLEVASRVAQRRWQETTVKSEIRLRALRGARLITPGQAVIREGYGQLRVIGSQWSDETPITELVCSLDSYAVPDIDIGFTLPSTGGSQQPPEPDIDFTFFEVPEDLQQGPTVEVVVFRLRAHEQIVAGRVFLSTDGTTYTNVGNQPYAQGGLLEEAIGATPTDIISVGPRFEPVNNDMDDVQDLSSNVTAWQSGAQLAYINGEMFFVQSFDVQSENDWSASTSISVGDFVRPTGSPNNLRFKATTSGTTGGSEPTWPVVLGDTVNDNGVIWEAHRFAYKPMNMIRARYGTSVESHAIGDTIYILSSEDVEQLSMPGFTPGQFVCAKTQPYTTGGEVDLSLVAPVCKTLIGNATTDFRVAGTDSRVTATGDRRIVTL